MKEDLRKFIREQIEFIAEEKKLKLSSNIRKRLNNDLYDLTTPNNQTRYFDKIPLQDIFNILKKYKIVALQEDNTEWDGFLVGSKAEVTFPIAPVQTRNPLKMYTPFDNAMLRMSWYKMGSGRYEIVAYVT